MYIISQFSSVILGFNYVKIPGIVQNTLNILRTMEPCTVYTCE